MIRTLLSKDLFHDYAHLCTPIMYMYVCVVCVHVCVCMCVCVCILEQLFHAYTRTVRTYMYNVHCTCIYIISHNDALQGHMVQWPGAWSGGQDRGGQYCEWSSLPDETLPQSWCHPQDEPGEDIYVAI